MSASVAPRSSPPAPSTRQQLDELDALLQRMLELPVNQVEEGPAADQNQEPKATAPEPAQVMEEVRDDIAIEAPAASRQPEPNEPAPRSSVRYPASFMVVETATAHLDQLPPVPALRLQPLPNELDTPPDIIPEMKEAARETAGGPRDVPPGPASLPLPSTQMAEDGETWVPLRSSWRPSEQTWQPLAETWQQAQAPAPTPSASSSVIEPLAELPMPAPVSSPETIGDQTLPESSSEGDPLLFPIRPLPATPPKDAEPVTDASRTVNPLVWLDRAFETFLAPLGAFGLWLRGPAGRTVLGALGLLCLVVAVALLVADGIGWTH